MHTSRRHQCVFQQNLVLYTHMHIYATIHIFMQKHNNIMIKTSEDFFKKIYLSLYLKGYVCERELETEQNCNILTPPTLMAISVVSFSFSRAAQPETQGPTPLVAGFLYHILLPTGLISKLTDFLSAPSYIIVQLPNSISLEWHV